MAMYRASGGGSGYTMPQVYAQSESTQSMSNVNCMQLLDVSNYTNVTFTLDVGERSVINRLLVQVAGGQKIIDTNTPTLTEYNVNVTDISRIVLNVRGNINAQYGYIGFTNIKVS